MGADAGLRWEVGGEGKQSRVLSVLSESMMNEVGSRYEVF